MRVTLPFAIGGTLLAVLDNVTPAGIPERMSVVASGSTSRNCSGRAIGLPAAPSATLFSLAKTCSAFAGLAPRLVALVNPAMTRPSALITGVPLRAFPTIPLASVETSVTAPVRRSLVTICN